MKTEDELKQAISEAVEKDEQEVSVDYYVASDGVSSTEAERKPTIFEYAAYYLGNLPGLRSDSIGIKILAACWYIFLFVFGFFGVSKTEGWSDKKNTVMDIITFTVLFSYTLYLGNYLGVRDILPWLKRKDLPVDLLRIASGCVILAGILMVIGVAVMLVLHID